MKKKNWLVILLILGCLFAGFGGGALSSWVLLLQRVNAQQIGGIGKVITASEINIVGGNGRPLIVLSADRSIKIWGEDGRPHAALDVSGNSGFLFLVGNRGENDYITAVAEKIPMIILKDGEHQRLIYVPPF